MLYSTNSLLCLSLALLSILFTIDAHESTCSDAFHGLAHAMNITNCKKLSTLEAEFGWNYHMSNRTTQIEILFGVTHNENLKWIAWGVNPQKVRQMVGTHAVIGIVLKNGTMRVSTYNITSYTKLGCQLLPSDNDIRIHDMRGQTLNSGGYMTLFAKFDLDNSVYNISSLNHAWQIGFKAEEERLEPKGHPETLQNFDSTETINLTSRESHGVGHHRRHLRIVHGILNIVGWGTLMPTGVIIARYFRKFPFEYPRKWYFFHLACQITGYVIGTIGWGIGLGLGRASKHYTFRFHRILGIFIFTFTTLQMFALRLRPKPDDDYRKYWDMYHHFLGYALLAGIAVNIFSGVGILSPNHKWKWAYIGILAILGSITLGLEIYTWYKFCTIRAKERKQEEYKRQQEEQKREETAP